MKITKFRDLVMRGVVLGLAVCATFIMTGCPGGGGGGSGGDDTQTYELSLGGLADNIELNAGETTELSFVGETPGPARTYETVQLNLQRILDSGSVQTASRTPVRLLDYLAQAISPRRASAAIYWQVSLRVGAAADLDSVCEEGLLYGPYTISGDSSPEQSDTERVAAEPSTVDLINIGQFALCIQITSPVDMMLSIRDYSVDVATCDEEPANFAGTWTGEYACDNVGCGDESGPIELTITQTGHSARYVDDSGAAYSGTVCGDEFAFDGGVEGPGGYVEKGRFTMNSDGTLRKESSFVTDDGSCRGDCEDSLERQDI